MLDVIGQRQRPREVGHVVGQHVQLETHLVVPEVMAGKPRPVDGIFPFRVRQRRIGGERSAYAELVVMAALLRLGYGALFAPPIDGRVLDAKCLVDGVPVYFEVVAPKCSDASAGQ